MARILISAYACAPGHGSEAEGGWNWVRWTALAGHHVTVVTQEAFVEDLTAAVPDGVAVIGVPPARWARLARGHPRVYTDYLAWQAASAGVVAQLHARRPFDLLHHVSWGSLMWGTPLWRIAAPLAFGPIGGGQVASPAFKDYFGSAWRKEALRSWLIRYVLPGNPRARATVRNARLVAVTNRATAATVTALGATRTLAMLDTGLSPADEADPPAAPERPPGQIDLIWIGRLLPIKALPLALEAVAVAARSVDVRLTVVGDGPLGDRVPGWIAELGLEDRVMWLGQVPHDRIADLLRASDALLFTSLRESFGAQVLEAAAQARPVIALDLHGVATHLPAAAGRKVAAVGRSDTVRGMAAAIVELAEDVAARQAAGRAARAFALTHRWAERVRALHEAAGIPPAAGGEPR